MHSSCYGIRSALLEDYKDSNLLAQLTAIHHHLSHLEILSIKVYPGT